MVVGDEDGLDGPLHGNRRVGGATTIYSEHELKLGRSMVGRATTLAWLALPCGGEGRRGSETVEGRLE